MYCTVNDVKIHYQVLPKDGAPTLLLMHGAGTRLNILKPLATKLSKYNRVLIDLPGHGKSAGRPLGSVAEYADFIEEFVRTLKLKDIYLVGYSMGGFIAIELAIRKKTPLKGLIMVDTTPQMEKNLEDSFKEQIRRDEFDEFHFLSYGGIWNWNVFRIVVTSLFYSLTHKPVMLADFQNCVLRFDRQQENDQIQLPALIITRRTLRNWLPRKLAKCWVFNFSCLIISKDFIQLVFPLAVVLSFFLF